ncbi:hypothetical protein EZS27_003588 [termite gut metagenome]|uniref:Antitoxin-like ribbon-helix-helix domain-containing protein n=1 Tax=termite gut metagenome TaxID=433724 RepID=A0A5J4SSS1_9ZZZZ
MGKKEDLKKRMQGGMDGLIRSTEKEKDAPVVDGKEKDGEVRRNFIIKKSYHTRLKRLAAEREVSMKELVQEALDLYFKTVDNKK